MRHRLTPASPPRAAPPLRRVLAAAALGLALVSLSAGCGFPEFTFREGGGGSAGGVGNGGGGTGTSGRAGAGGEAAGGAAGSNGAGGQGGGADCPPDCQPFVVTTA